MYANPTHGPYDRRFSVTTKRKHAPPMLLACLFAWLSAHMDQSPSPHDLSNSPCIHTVKLDLTYKNTTLIFTYGTRQERVSSQGNILPPSSILQQYRRPLTRQMLCNGMCLCTHQYGKNGKQIVTLSKRLLLPQISRKECKNCHLQRAGLLLCHYSLPKGE